MALARSTITAGVWGLAASLLGVFAGQLASLAVDPAASPLDAVGGAVIDATPAPVKEWAIATFGTGDKAFLLVVISLGVAGLGWTAGVIERRRAWAGAALLTALGVGSGVVALLRSGSPARFIPGVVAAAVAVLVLRLAVGRIVDAASVPGIERRSVLIGGAGVAAGGLGLFATESLLRPGATGRPPIVLPTPSSPPTLAPGLEGRIPGITPLRTPTPDFYRIDIALSPPRMEPADWSVTIDGKVRNPYSITFDELLAMPMVERDITLTCVSNPIGGRYCGSTRWQGVLVADLIARADPEPGADQVLSMGKDGFSASTPLDVLRDGRDAMIAIAMDGAPLTAEHGYPARLVTPGLYGYVGATKWLTRLNVTTFADAQAYWTKRGWSERGPVKTSARIDVPASGVDAGSVTIAGVAWATHRGISRVEVRVDGGPWQQATLGTDVGLDYWRQWYVETSLEAGRHEIAARAYDGRGEVQDETVRDVVPDGATGYHVRTITVA